MTKKIQQKHLDNLLRELNEGLEDMQDYYYLAEEYQAKAAALLYKLNEYCKNTNRNYEPNP